VIKDAKFHELAWRSVKNFDNCKARYLSSRQSRCESQGTETRAEEKSRRSSARDD
jgi:hypothetical protein